MINLSFNLFSLSILSFSFGNFVMSSESSSFNASSFFLWKISNLVRDGRSWCCWVLYRLIPYSLCDLRFEMSLVLSFGFIRVFVSHDYAMDLFEANIDRFEVHVSDFFNAVPNLSVLDSRDLLLTFDFELERFSDLNSSLDFAMLLSRIKGSSLELSTNSESFSDWFLSVMRTTLSNWRIRLCWAFVGECCLISIGGDWIPCWSYYLGDSYYVSLFFKEYSLVSNKPFSCWCYSFLFCVLKEFVLCIFLFKIALSLGWKL